MLLDRKRLIRITPKGIKKVYGPSSGNKTQKHCENSVGTMLRPMVIFKSECFNYDWVKGEVPGTVNGMSPNGWIDQDLFTK